MCRLNWILTISISLGLPGLKGCDRPDAGDSPTGTRTSKTDSDNLQTVTSAETEEEAEGITVTMPGGETILIPADIVERRPLTTKREQQHERARGGDLGLFAEKLRITRHLLRAMNQELVDRWHDFPPIGSVMNTVDGPFHLRVIDEALRAEVSINGRIVFACEVRPVSSAPAPDRVTQAPVEWNGFQRVAFLPGVEETMSIKSKHVKLVGVGYLPQLRPRPWKDDSHIRYELADTDLMTIAGLVVKQHSQFALVPHD